MNTAEVGGAVALDPRPRLRAEPDPGRAARAVGRIDHRAWLMVGGLVVLGLVVRLLIVRGIWVDEAISVHQAQLSLPDMLDDLRDTDNHPPLHYLMLWGSLRLFGDGELAVRLPSILAGTALVPALFLAGRELFDRRAGLMAAGLGTIAPLLVWYSQEARMYVLVMLLATLAVWAQMRVLNDGRRRWWFAYGAFAVALVYTNYFALIPIAIQQLGFGLAAWRRAQRAEPVRELLIGYWVTWVAIVAAVAPLAPFAFDQFHHNEATGFSNAPSAGSAGGAEGSSASVYAVISNLAWGVWGYHANATMLSIAALWPLLMLVSLLLLGKGRSPATMLVLALALGPVLVLLVVGLAKRELFEVRYFAAAAPMMLLLLARAVSAPDTRRGPAALATVALVASLLAGLADQQLSRNPRDFDFRGALTEVRERARPGDTILFAPGYLRDVVSYYTPGLEQEPLPRAGEGQPRGRIFLVASFLEDEGLAARVRRARQALIDQGHELVRTSRHERIRTWEFS
jgi:uncharacterized membrane protein